MLRVEATSEAIKGVLSEHLQRQPCVSAPAKQFGDWKHGTSRRVAKKNIHDANDASEEEAAIIYDTFRVPSAFLIALIVRWRGRAPKKAILIEVWLECDLLSACGPAGKAWRRDCTLITRSARNMKDAFTN